MKIKRVQTIFSFFISAVFCLVSPSIYAEQLVVPGTGASEVLLQDLALAFNAENPGKHSGFMIELINAEIFTLLMEIK